MSPVHLPEGQRVPPTAVHPPAQLTPSPQLTVVVVLSTRQQTTSIVSLLKVKLFSNSARLPEGPLVVWFAGGAGPGVVEGTEKSFIISRVVKYLWDLKLAPASQSHKPPRL